MRGINFKRMFAVFGFLAGGLIAGWFLRRRRFAWTGRLSVFLIWLLLFLLGLEAGGNRMVMQSLPSLGLEALGVAVACAAGSCVMALLLWTFVRKRCASDDRKGMHGESGSGKSTAGSEGGTGLRAVADSIVIVAFFAAGILCGLYGLLPFDVTETGIAVYALYALIFVVGFSIGNSPDVIGSFRRLSPGLALLPLCTVIGTLAASALMGLLLPHRSVQETMAVGSGFAYYSLSSIIITEYKGAELGTVALVANIVREFITLLAAPLLARWFGPLAPIAAGGATTADVTLPIITNTCGERYAVLSIYHGFVVDFSVPFLVTFFCVL